MSDTKQLTCAMDVVSGEFPNGDRTFLCEYDCDVKIWDGEGETPTSLTPFTRCAGAGLPTSDTVSVVPVEIEELPAGNTFFVSLGE